MTCCFDTEDWGNSVLWNFSNHCKITLCHNQKDHNFNFNRHEDFKSHILGPCLWRELQVSNINFFSVAEEC
jgi:hypothetical protein